MKEIHKKKLFLEKKKKKNNKKQASTNLENVSLNNSLFISNMTDNF